MNKYLKYLALATLCISVYGITKADVDHLYNKTQLNSRSDGTNLAFWYAPGLQEMFLRKDKHKFGGTLFATTFIRQGSMDAKYWTPQDKNGFEITDFAETQKMYIFNEFVSHRLFDQDETNVSFNPKQTAYGVTLAYDYRIDKLIEGLYFNIQVPMVHLKNDLGMRIEKDFQVDDDTRNHRLAKYLAGKFDDPNGDWEFNTVKKLKYAHINGMSNATGIADIDVRIGYTIFHRCKYNVSANFGFTIPTGTEAEAVKLHEAIVGNHQHWGVGGGLNGDVRVWGNKNHNVILYADLKYRYLFKADETRTFGLKHTQWGHYLPLINYKKAQQDPEVWELVPAANLTTLNVDVRPGSEFEGILAFAYNTASFSVNLGYNLYCRASEAVEREDKNPFINGDEWAYFSTVGGRFTPLTADYLVINNARTHSQVTHKVFGGIAWTYKEWTPIVNFSTSAYYEFANKDEAYQGYGFSGVIGISF